MLVEILQNVEDLKIMRLHSMYIAQIDHLNQDQTEYFMHGIMHLREAAERRIERKVQIHKNQIESPDTEDSYICDRLHRADPDSVVQGPVLLLEGRLIKHMVVLQENAKSPERPENQK